MYYVVSPHAHNRAQIKEATQFTATALITPTFPRQITENTDLKQRFLSINPLLLKSEKLKASAKNNTVKDFEFSYFDDIDDALIEGLSQNQDFFSLLLSNDEIKRQVLGIFTDEIYQSLRSA